MFALKMTTSWVGTDPKNDIPLPNNVRRYYLPSSTHGGGGGGFNESHPERRGQLSRQQLGHRYAARESGAGHGAGQPNEGGTARMGAERIRRRPLAAGALMLGPQKWKRNLVEPTKAAMGFPSGVPSIPDSIFLPENFVFPVLDYDWGPDYDHSEASGIPTNAPPPIKRVIKMLVPRVDADGNELGGVPTVLRDAPLGTYLGWNITAAGSSTRGQVCNYVGGMVPFAKTRAQRLAAGDPRPSLEERYVSHDGYVAAVKAAADNAACQGYLLAGPGAAAMGAKCTTSIPAGFPDDWALLVNAAIASNVCNQPGDGGMCNPAP